MRVVQKEKAPYRNPYRSFGHVRASNGHLRLEVVAGVVVDGEAQRAWWPCEPTSLSIAFPSSL